MERFSFTASFVMVVSNVISDTPTCFFLKPSFQSACAPHSRTAEEPRTCPQHTFATLLFPPPGFLAAGVAFLPAFLEIAWA